jgi:deoxyribose-phosphate aldolase
LCSEARTYGFASVCVNPSNVKLCVQLLKGSPVAICTVVGFPLGATPTDVKVFEAQQAIREGATEIDMVINVGAVKSREYELVRQDIASVAKACHAANAILKVILEAALLTDEEKVIACQLAKVAGADFVKTSTGFGPGGATAEDVALMRRVVGPNIGVKAAGGIRTTEDARRMIAAGASRIGASASVKIVGGMDEKERSYGR